MKLTNWRNLGSIVTNFSGSRPQFLTYSILLLMVLILLVNRYVFFIFLSTVVLTFLIFKVKTKDTTRYRKKQNEPDDDPFSVFYEMFADIQDKCPSYSSDKKYAFLCQVKFQTIILKAYFIINFKRSLLEILRICPTYRLKGLKPALIRSKFLAAKLLQRRKRSVLKN